MDRYDLYEACVQHPPMAVSLLRAIHAGRGDHGPRVLGEDFCGTAAVSREWVNRIEGGRAVAVDHDEEPLVRACGHERIQVVQADVMSVDESADVLFVGNFSIGEIHARPALVAYLRHTHGRLSRAPSGMGVFVCDTYGGESAFLTGSVERDHPAEGGARIRYRWEQRDADPLTGMVTNVLHFRVFRGRDLVLDLPNAFTYRWRLWSVPELRDAMLEAGFESISVYATLPDAADGDGHAYCTPITDPADLDDSFIVCVAGFVRP